MNRKLLLAALIVGAVAVQWIRARPNTETVLPNGFVLKRDTLLTADRRRVLVPEVEFVCFDDRFVRAVSKVRGEGGLFDADSQGWVSVQDHPETRAPGGLLPRQTACNGYYTIMIGPGLLHGTRAPFLPPCFSVNRDNPALRDRGWLERPCADEPPPRAPPTLPAAPRP